jgi:hypothetical protein
MSKDLESGKRGDSAASAVPELVFAPSCRYCADALIVTARKMLERILGWLVIRIRRRRPSDSLIWESFKILFRREQIVNLFQAGLRNIE